MSDQVKKYLTAKELAYEFSIRGINHHVYYYNAMIADCPHSIRSKHLAFEDAFEWWRANPQWKPRAKKADSGGVLMA